MKTKLGVGGGGRGPWAQTKSGMVPSPASEMAKVEAVKPKFKPGVKPIHKTGPTRGITKRMIWV